jgi:hypothetical protein
MIETRMIARNARLLTVVAASFVATCLGSQAAAGDKQKAQQEVE